MFQAMGMLIAYAFLGRQDCGDRLAGIRLLGISL